MAAVESWRRRGNGGGDLGGRDGESRLRRGIGSGADRGRRGARGGQMGRAGMAGLRHHTVDPAQAQHDSLSHA